MIGDLSRSTFSNIEHQSIDFVVHTIRPWLVRWEQAITRSLLNDFGINMDTNKKQVIDFDMQIKRHKNSDCH